MISLYFRAQNDAITNINTSITRSYVQSICGNGVVERSGNVCALQYTIAFYDPNGTVVPSELRPHFGNGVWGPVTVTNDYSNNYTMQVTYDGKVQIQKNGVSVTTQLQSVRGQLVWII